MAAPIAAAPLVIGGILGSIVAMSGIATPVARWATQTGNKLWSNNIPAEDILVDMRWRRIITEEEYIKLMEKHGFDEPVAIQIFNSAQNNLTPLEAINLFRRGVLDKEQFENTMKRNRISSETAEKMLKANEFIPGPQDMIRFAVRDAYRDDIIQKYQADSFFPTDAEIQEVVAADPDTRKSFTGMQRLIADALELGIQPDKLRLYWRSHWELPSITAATEMFHRLNPEFEKEHPVSEEDFEELLRTQDVMPFWIPRLKKVLYAQPTRVDIRAMYRDGVLTEAEVLEAYRKLGYNQQDAERLTALAKTFYKDEDRQLSRELIQKAFKFKEISEDEAVKHLQSLGYSEIDSKLIIKLQTLANDEKVLEERIDTATELFVKGIISELEFTSELDSLQLSSQRREIAVQDAIQARIKKQKIPSLEDVGKFATKKIIGKDEATELLKENGVRDIDVPKYLKLWGVAG